MWAGMLSYLPHVQSKLGRLLLTRQYNIVSTVYLSTSHDDLISPENVARDWNGRDRRGAPNCSSGGRRLPAERRGGRGGSERDGGGGRGKAADEMVVRGGERRPGASAISRMSRHAASRCRRRQSMDRRRRRNPTVLASCSSSPLRRRPFDRRGAREGDGTTSRRSTRGYFTSPTPPSRLGRDRESGSGGRSYESPPPTQQLRRSGLPTAGAGGRAGGGSTNRCPRSIDVPRTGTISKFPTSRFCWHCTRWIDCRGRVPDGQSGRGADIRRRRFCFFSGTARIAPRPPPSSLADDPSPVAPLAVDSTTDCDRSIDSTEGSGDDDSSFATMPPRPRIPTARGIREAVRVR